MSVCMETTSVGRWRSDRAEVAGGGRVVTVLSFGPDARHRANELVATFAGTRVNWLRLPPGWTELAADVLERQLVAARVGWRLVLVGAEAPVLAAQAQALAAGVLGEEILAEVVDSRGVDAELHVHCAHCATVHEASVPVGGLTRCPECAADLVVYHHLSRRTGAYLGYMHDAEER
ncbi:dimethylamine monooxygenase subunit DmmA family protein [Rhodococcus sp. NPDC003318]|uniref:dimethylamine monooxygenase subunit DmmA family protein n=1 Tax=Rhodococcus sp. NPDC003318 TaxID=3364503 RepID=UPI00368FE98B